MLSWNPLSMLRWARPVLGLSLVALVLADASASGGPPITVQAELEADAPRGAAVRITAGDYPPADPNGSFALEAGDDAGVFSLDDTTGTLTLNRPDKLETWPTLGALTVEYTRRGESESQSSRRKFLRAAGLTDQEISRRLGLVTRYAIGIQIISRPPALEVSSRPLHFVWPAEGGMINRVQAQSSEPGTKLLYRLSSEEPAGWIEIDPDAGVLSLTDRANLTAMSATTWRGIVEVSDALGQKAEVTVWVTEPLALPTFSVPSLRTFWPGEGLAVVRAHAWSRVQEMLSAPDSWRFDPSRFAHRLVPTPAPTEPAAPVTASANVETSPRREAATNPPVSSTTWLLASLAASLATLLYVIFRPKKEDSVSEKNAEAEIKGSERQPPADEDVEWGDLLNSPPSAPSERSSAPASRKMFSSGPSAPRGPVALPFPESHAGPDDSPAPPAVNRPAAAELTVAEDNAGSPAPSTEELETLLSLLEQEPSVPQAAVEAHLESELSVADYMESLLAKYSKSGSTPTTPPVSGQPAGPRAADSDPSAGRAKGSSRPIPAPICNYDREMTRTQLETLRKTSNLTAAHAIRAAAARRRRRNLLRCGMLILVLLGLYALRVFVLPS